MNAIYEWSKENNLKLNALKSIHMRFILKNLVEIPLYKIDVQTIHTEYEHKRPKVFLDDKLSLRIYCKIRLIVANWTIDHKNRERVLFDSTR